MSKNWTLVFFNHQPYLRRKKLEVIRSFESSFEHLSSQQRRTDTPLRRRMASEDVLLLVLQVQTKPLRFFYRKRKLVQVKGFAWKQRVGKSHWLEASPNGSGSWGFPRGGRVLKNYAGQNNLDRRDPRRRWTISDDPDLLVLVEVDLNALQTEKILLCVLLMLAWGSPSTGFRRRRHTANTSAAGWSQPLEGRWGVGVVRGLWPAVELICTRTLSGLEQKSVVQHFFQRRGWWRL